ncbi:MAG: PD-(D/E)XK nuclease domain-containing protein [Thermodesulfobacteriota bacterium]|nr:PD-(D/E)XK nuclease domain-containing protein [Thermodesulfobacteriota bacterium]
MCQLWIIEFLGIVKEQALNQIKDKKYFEKYQGKGKKIYLFGVEFADRNVGEWVYEKTP